MNIPMDIKIRARRTQRGFSLVELLVVIAVIGMIAAIGVPTIGFLLNSSRETKNRRNAQSIVNIWNAAQTAGVDTSSVVLTGDKVTIAKNIFEFLSTPRNGRGAASDTTFFIDLEENDIAAAAAYYDWENDMLTYTAGGDGQ